MNFKFENEIFLLDFKQKSVFLIRVVKSKYCHFVPPLEKPLDTPEKIHCFPPPLEKSFRRRV